jgi:hypothetical protein
VQERSDSGTGSGSAPIGIAPDEQISLIDQSPASTPGWDLHCCRSTLDLRLPGQSHGAMFNRSPLPPVCALRRAVESASVLIVNESGKGRASG